MPNTIYSYKDTVGVIASVIGSFSFAGNIGVGHIIVSYATERTAHDTAADGNIMVSYVAGNSGHATVEVQQTSALNNYLVSWFNALTVAADNADVSNWATTTINITSILDGTSHTLTGVSPGKIPDKTYGPQGARLTWTLMAANVTTQAGIATPLL